MELELLELENKIEATTKEHDNIQKETKQVRDQIQKVKSHLSKCINELYAPHEVQMNLFSTKIEGVSNQYTMVYYICTSILYIFYT